MAWRSSKKTDELRGRVEMNMSAKLSGPARISPGTARSAVFGQAGIFALAFLVAFGLALAHFAERGGIGRSWQISYAPAVFMGCTGVFGQPKPLAAGAQEPPWSKALNDFLRQDMRTFDCSTVPDGLEINPFTGYVVGDDRETIGLQYSQLGHLIMTGLVWRVMGVSWWSVSYIASLYFGLAFAFLTLIFCRFVVAPVALVFAFLPFFDTRTFHLVERLRDFAKIAPIFAAMFILVTLASVSSSRRALGGLIALGCALSIGVTLRPEVLLYCGGILVLAALVLYARREAVSAVAAIGGLAVCLALILAVYIPVSMAYRDRPGYMSHALILGMQDQRLKEAHLNVRSLSVMPIFSDQSVYRDADLLQRTITGDPLLYETDVYGMRTDAVFGQMLTDAPYYAVARIAGAAYDFFSGPFGLAPNTAMAQFARMAMSLSALFTLVMLWRRNAAFGFAATGLIVLGAAISSLDYEWRHVMHMQWLVFPLAVVGPGILIQRAFRAAGDKHVSGLLGLLNKVPTGPPRQFLFLLTLTGLSIYVLVLAVAGWAQVRGFNTLRDTLMKLDVTPVRIERRIENKNMEVQTFAEEKAPFLVRLDFNLTKCGKHYVRAQYRYRGKDDPSYDKSSPIDIYRGGKEGESYFFTVHDDSFTTFDGIALNAADSNCLHAAYRVASPQPPFYYHMLVDGRWQPLGSPRF